MFAKKIPKPTRLDMAIDALLTQITDTPCDTAEYAKMVDQLTKLYKLKEIDTPKRVSQDTLYIIAANLIGIVLILSYERTNVLTSRAIAFVTKLR